MTEKPVAYFSRKDRHGERKIHPVFAKQLHERREPKAKVYRVQESSAQVEIPARTVVLKLTTLPVKDLKPSKSAPLNEETVAYFEDRIRNGKTIPPPLVHKLPDGSIEIMDGHHRIEAYRRVGVKEIPVVENSLKETLQKVGSTLWKGAKTSAHLAGRVAGAPRVLREEYSAGKQRHLEHLVERSESPNRATRLLALAKIRKEYPEIYEQIAHELKTQVTKCRYCGHTSTGVVCTHCGAPKR